MAFLDIWKVVSDPLIAIINKVVPDKAAAAAAVAQLQLLQAQGALQEEFAQLTSVTSAQSDIDKIEAGSASLFVSGWRPAVGWVCAAGVACIFIVSPIFTWLSSLVGHPTPFPVLDTGSLTTLLFALLGMGTLRTVDKVKGVASR